MERITFHETGVTKIDSSAAGFTVSVAVFEVWVLSMLTAFILVVPVARDVASPDELIDATVGAEESQSTDDVRSWVDLSVKVPIATNCCVLPRGMAVFVGVIVNDVRRAGVTVSDADVETTELYVAIMMVVPVLTEVTSPFVPNVLNVATDVSKDIHVTKEVRSCVALFTSVPEAVNCCIVPFAMLALAGLTTIDATGEDMRSAVPVIPA